MTRDPHDPLLADLHTYVVADSPKMLRETLCVAQSAISALMRRGVESAGGSMDSHLQRIGRLIEECDRKRPLGPGGTHGDRHTEECGCGSRSAGTVDRGAGR